MIIPVWYLVIWVGATLASLSVCAAILRERQLRTWPALFATAALSVVAFVLLVRKQPYAQFFWTSWTISLIEMLLRIWLAWDVVRALPAIRFLPMRMRLGILAFGIAGALLSFVSMPLVHPWSASAESVVLLNQCVIFTWCGAVLCCLAGMLSAGFGFTATGIRVAIGELLRMLSSACASWCYAHFLSPTPEHIHIKATANAVDTIVGIGVSAYWSWAVLRARRDHAALLVELTQITLQPPEPREG